jgi:hypothetical protein
MRRDKFKDIAAQFIGQLCLINEATTKIMRGCEFNGKVFEIARLSVLLGAMPLDGSLTAKR